MAANYTRLKAAIAAASAAAVVWGWAYFDGSQTFAEPEGTAAAEPALPATTPAPATPASSAAAGSGAPVATATPTATPRAITQATPARRTRGS